ncbi:MAG: hypothetical protein KatS3mg113_1126 [Planctomycetaceae bacterium]|nr:MAG: hypothetical protein KatS3mg113_1126 [Planctomycetaceae bacterium]
MRHAVWLLLMGWVCWGASTGEAQNPPTKELSPEEKEAIAQLRKLGGLVIEVAQNDPRLDVSLHLADTKIENQHLVFLKPLERIAALNLRGTEVSDEGLQHLAHLKGLVRLHLEKTKITDAGLVHLKGLENLEYLNLYGTAVTDAGLNHLAGLKKLKRLYLWQTQVTDAGVAALKQALPDVQIIRGQDLAKPAEQAKPAEEKKE